MRAIRVALALPASMLLLASTTAPAVAAHGTKYTPATRSHGGVVAAEAPEAAKIGVSILDAGGNAMDAAAATVFGLNVAIPYDCGIGGGGYMVYRSANGEVAALDFREMAPAAFTPTTLDVNGINKSETGHLVIGVPGVLAGVKAMLDRYGTMSLARVLAPATTLARSGFAVNSAFTAIDTVSAPRMRLYPAAAQQYLIGGVAPYPPGATLAQPQLADTFDLIAHQGIDVLYRGAVGQKVIDDMTTGLTGLPGDVGLMTMKDLGAYRPIWRTPITTTYRDATVVAEPPSTSGGIATLETLNILEGFDLARAGQGSGDHLHLLAEAEKIAWADRNQYVADTAFVNVPVARLTSKEYAAKRRQEIDPQHAKSYQPGSFGGPQQPAGADKNRNGDTTSIAVIDARGDAVALTCTLEQAFGSGVVAPGTGFMLNGELNDFSGAGTANQPQGGKRPRSSISPTIVVRGGHPVLAVGGAGGTTIIMGSIQAVINLVDFHNDVAEAIDAEREEAMGEPTDLMLESVRVSAPVIADLIQRGHNVVSEGEYGTQPHVNAVGWDLASCDKLGTSDPRGDAYATFGQAGSGLTVGCAAPPVAASGASLPLTLRSAAPLIAALLLVMLAAFGWVTRRRPI